MTQGGNLPLYHFHVPMGTLLSGFLFGLKNRLFCCSHVLDDADMNVSETHRIKSNQITVTSQYYRQTLSQRASQSVQQHDIHLSLYHLSVSHFLKLMPDTGVHICLKKQAHKTVITTKIIKTN